jgi:hypothetical protein
MEPLSSSAARLRTGHAATALVLLGALLGLATIAFPEHSTAATAAPTATATKLVGTLQLTPGSCSGGRAAGTYFRMILPSGHAGGPYLSNSDSTCSDQSFTPLSPGSDGGLRFGSYQPTPDPRFSSNGDARAHRITAPATFYGTAFATATGQVDPQTRTAVAAPRLTVTGSRVTAGQRSVAGSWNNQDFNQGAPKPNGSTPGNTALPTGSYDASTGAITLNWASQIVGGPFDKFTGAWHFEGRFVPAAGSTSSGSTGQSGQGATSTTTGSSRGGTGSAAAPGLPAAPPGKPSSAGTPTAADAPGAAPIAQTESAAPVTKVFTQDRWRVAWPVIGLAVGMGLLAIGALVLFTVLSRRAETS